MPVIPARGTGNDGPEVPGLRVSGHQCGLKHVESEEKYFDMGITPFAPGFAAWYLQWLNDPQRPG